MAKITAWVVVLVSVLIAGPAGAQTGFGLPLKGEKTVVLSDKVGRNGDRKGNEPTETCRRSHQTALQGFSRYDLPGKIVIAVAILRDGVMSYTTIPGLIYKK